MTYNRPTWLFSENFFFFKLEANYFTILSLFLPHIDMNQPWVYTCSPSWTPLPLPSFWNFKRTKQNKTKTIPLSLLNQVFPASKCIWMEIRKRLRQKGLKETTPSPGFTREAVLWSLSQQFHLDVFLSKTRNDSSEIHHWKAEKQTITYGYVRSFLFV